ncbi:DUF6093 family protein [Microbispora sp. ATCC PTA-5024]|uniref:DUF6093 family protein n=1 Tax=Microbispora sp. ATCC PTA-5024 TaxID=316330 RepID=UPI0003DC309D|nr:DUF6093 family protein [Microbispora sp. ATCC PTA-5024]ETK36130.1 hypothetical protein MPTA5024_10925 [Microbispora sp. ATCC PTA-5024]
MTDRVLEQALADGRREALALMRDTCTIERKSGTSFDPTTGKNTATWAPVYTGPCRVKATAAGNDVQFGEGEATLHKYEIRLPWDAAPEVRREDRVTVTASDDQWVLGRHLEVVDVGFNGTSTARRITVEDRS